MSDVKRMGVITIRRIVSTSLIMIPVAFIYCFIYAIRNADKEVDFNINTANSIVSKVLSGDLQPNKQGVVELLSSYSRTSVRGLITITRKNGAVLIYFPTRYERFGARGYLYTSVPLDFKNTKMIDGVRSIAVKSDFRTDANSESENEGLTTLPLTRMLSEHWWRVEQPDQQP